MPHTAATTSCNADDEGRLCNREPVMLRPVALCHAHRIEVALAVLPDLLRDQLAVAHRDPVAPVPRLDLVAAARTATAGDLLDGVHDAVVYFIANGGRVKIGYTTNLRSRLGSLTLRSDAVLLALHGGPDLERALHVRFAAYRNGNTEWFELAPEIFRYIAASHPTATTVAALAQQTGASVPVEVSSTADAVLRAHATDPNASSSEIVEQLATWGVATSAAYVRTVLSRDRKKGGPYL